MADNQPDSRSPVFDPSAEVKRRWRSQSEQKKTTAVSHVQRLDLFRKRWLNASMGLPIRIRHSEHSNTGTPLGLLSGLQNAESHLFKDHNGVTDPSGRRSSLKFPVATQPARSIATLLRLNPEVLRDQEIANLLIKRFNKTTFQQMIVHWIVNTNRSFATARDPDLRAIFEYLNPSVSITEAHISDVTVRSIAEREFNANKTAVRETLRKSPGQVHIQFDGWASGNRHALYGVTCIFRNLDNKPRKCVLGLPELLGRHTGENIAGQMLDIIQEFDIGDKVGYFTLDNASNNKTTMEELARELGFDWKKRWVRCIAHVVNIVVKHMLFGQDPDAFEQQIYDGQFTAAREHEQWRKRGLVGKWHNFAVEVNRSGIWADILKKVQQVESQLSDDPAIQTHHPVGVVLDNATRWLSQLAMIDRALALRPFYDPFIQRALSEWNKANLTKSGSLRKGARLPFFLKEENRITTRDWCVLQALRDILLDFQLVVKAMEGDGQGKHRKESQEGEVEPPLSGTSWDLLHAYEYLLESLEFAKKIAVALPDSGHLAVNYGGR
ncbi:hypothetical protein H9L39_17619 [Fusarium oxysporum f. sp. albedinis]|nr:hypothetical protein H9L39_17619 [Fusarium oxysporum f. sp. albedinis]